MSELRMFIILALFFTPISATTKVYIHSNESSPCPGQPCFLLDEYARNVSSYSTRGTGTEVIFLSGEHTLTVSLNLNSVTNITFTGNDEVTIMFAQTATFSGSDIMLNLLKIKYKGPFHALTIFHSHAVLKDVDFVGIDQAYSMSEAVHCINSTMRIANCSFSGGLGKVVDIRDRSHVNFSGKNTFYENIYKNVAGSSGGLIHVESSEAIFTDINTFYHNLGPQVTTKSSKIEFHGLITFKENPPELSINNHGTKIITDDSNGNGGALYALESEVIMKGNINFISNRVMEGSGGAVFLDNSTLYAEGNISFIDNIANNRGGAIYALDSDIQLSGNACFENNKAQSGGAIVFDGDSTISWLAPVVTHFIRNEAEEDGGALLFLDPNSITVCENQTTLEKPCFFNLSNFYETQLYFIENSAGHGGSVLYGGAIDQCIVGGNVSGFTAFHNVSTINSTDDIYITSNPIKICFCNENKDPECSLSERDPIKVSRGQRFQLSLVSVGQANMPVFSTIRAYTQKVTDKMKFSNPSHKCNTKCGDLDYKLSSSEDNETLILYPDGPCGLSAKKTIMVIFEDCPAGFILDNSTMSCNCEERLKKLNPNVVCDIDSELIKRPNGTWLKPIWNDTDDYTGFILSRYCPLGYCNDANITNLDFSFVAHENVSDAQCQENRRGTLCGACKENHSLNLNTFHCEICGNENISLVVLFAFAGVVLIVMLTGLHMTVATGTINGLILYANIVGANKDIFFPNQRNFLTVFISWLNLDFGIESCLFHGLDFYTYVWLQYVFPVYLWCLMGIIILSSRRSAIMMRLLGSNPVAVLATLILLSYTKILQNVIMSLSFTELEYPDYTTQYVWMFDGNLGYFKGRHM